MFRPATLFAVAFALIIAGHSGASAEADLSGFQGFWRAVDLQSTDPEAFKGIDEEHLSGRIAIDDDTIRLSGSALVDTGGESIRFVPGAVELVFFPSDRPAVLAPMDAKSKLLGGLISDPEVADPLKGETLRWARADGDRIVFYRFAIDESGAYTLGQYTLQKQGDGLSFVFTAYAQARPPVTIRATLERERD